jgi:molybdenum cofactor cytidylyltransferase
MNVKAVDVKEASGRLLYTTILWKNGKKLLPKGHTITSEDVQVLETVGLKRVWIAELESGELSEQTVVIEVAKAIGCGSTEFRVAPGGRANLFATEACCILVDIDLLKRINAATGVVIGTRRNFSYASAGTRIATIKSAPFAVSQRHIDAVVSILKERGPILQARPVRSPSVAVIYSDLLSGNKARAEFESVMCQRLSQLNIVATHAICCREDDKYMSAVIRRLLDAKPACVIVASATAPAGPSDCVGRAMVKAGCVVERFLAPVEPGGLMLLAYRGDTPVVSIPGCYRSAKTNVLDLILPPILAGHRLSNLEIASLGHGGLLL